MILTKDFYSVPEVAEILNLNRMTINIRVRQNKIKAQRIGKNWAISKEEVENLIKKEAK